MSNETKQVAFKVLIEVPESAADQDIKDYIDVEFGGFNSYKQDNPCAVKGVDVLEVIID